MKKQLVTSTDFFRIVPKCRGRMDLKIVKKQMLRFHFCIYLHSTELGKTFFRPKEELYPEQKQDWTAKKMNEWIKKKRARKKQESISKEFWFGQRKGWDLTTIEHHQHDFIIIGSHGAHVPKRNSSSQYSKE